ncbi:MAG: proP [Gammaproteobacteria bacterium]|nr:proP [Gammaproteobacteria bacterium]
MSAPLANLHRSGLTSSFAARLDRVPIGGFHRKLLFLIGAGLLVDGFDVYLTAGISGALVREGVADLRHIAYLAMSTSIGLGVGGFIFGNLGDRIGRRHTMQWTLVLVVLGNLAAAVSTTFPQLLGWRFLSCLGLGGETILGYATLSEFLPPQWRGRWSARLGFLANLGVPLGLFVGYFLLPQPSGWRVMLAIPGFAAAVVFLFRLKLVESPRWLASRGRDAQAEAVVRAIEATVSPDSSFSPSPADLEGALSGVPPNTPGGGSDGLFSAAHRGRLAVAIAINVAIMCAIFGFVSWLPTFFAASGQSIAHSVVFAGVMAIGAPAGTLAGMLITDKVERKWGVIATSLLAVLLGTIYAFAKTPAAILGIGFLDVTVLYAFGTLGLVGYVPELFPTALRMRAVGLCATAGRLVVIVLPLIVVPIFSAKGQAGVVSLIGLILLVETAIVLRWGVRTRGRSLESI